MGDLEIRFLLRQLRNVHPAPGSEARVMDLYREWAPRPAERARRCGAGPQRGGEGRTTGGCGGLWTLCSGQYLIE